MSQSTKWKVWVHGAPIKCQKTHLIVDNNKFYDCWPQICKINNIRGGGKVFGQHLSTGMVDPNELYIILLPTIWGSFGESLKILTSKAEKLQVFEWYCWIENRWNFGTFSHSFRSYSAQSSYIIPIVAALV